MNNTIAIVYGGKSGEHSVSRRSAASVVKNIDKNRWKTLLIGIAESGKWYLQSPQILEACLAGALTLGLEETPEAQICIVPGMGSYSFALSSGKSLGDIAAVFPVLHGSFGEDGCIQGLFEMAGIPYVGAKVTASAIAMDKDYTKSIWQQSGLPVLPWICIKTLENSDTQKALVEKAERDFCYPLFVKPANAGSSVGAAKVEDRAALEEAIKNAAKWDDKVILEPFIKAREIECSVTGNSSLTAYTPGEVIPTSEFYDYESKYIDPDGAHLAIPAQIPEESLAKIRNLAKKAYSSLGVSGLSRVDFFMDKNSGEIFLNEINTLPGFTSISMFPQMCEASGLGYTELLDKLIELAIENQRHFSTRSYRYQAI